MNKFIVLGLILLATIVGFQYLQLNSTSSDFNTPNSDNCPKLTGKIVLKDGSGYDKGRLVANNYKSKDKFPEVIVYAQNAQDVQNAVLWARCKQLPIRVRSGGHQHEGFSTGSGVVLIDVSEMKELKLDKAANIATIQPGLNNLELYTRLYKEGVTHVGGTCSEVGLSGLVLSGGMGPLLRRVGLTCDSLVSVDVVDANGRIIHATKDNEHKDLFWATRGGGGGNFGVITSMSMKVYPAVDVTWFNIGWDWDQPVDKVLAAWQDFFAKPDRNWFSHLDFWSKAFPTNKLKKQPVKMLGMFWGTPEQAREQLSDILNIGTPEVTIELVNWEQAIKNIEESTAVFLTDKPEYKSTGAYAMDSLPSEGLKIIDDTFKDSTAPLLNVLIYSMGGATADIAPAETAYFYRKAKFFLIYTSQWLDENKDKEYIAELNSLRERLLPYTVGDYVGNPDSDLKNYLHDYYGDNVNRLKCVKKKYDPDDLFHFEQGIPPAKPGECLEISK